MHPNYSSGAFLKEINHQIHSAGSLLAHAPCIIGRESA